MKCREWFLSLGRRKSVSRAETSSAEKNLSNEDKDIMLRQVMNGMPTDADDEFFHGEVNCEEEPEAGSASDKITPTKVKAEIEEPAEQTPEEKRRLSKISKISNAASLAAFRENLAQKFFENLESKKDKMQIAINKLGEAEEKLQSAQEGGNTNEAIRSYASLLQKCKAISDAWMDGVSDEKVKEVTEEQNGADGKPCQLPNFVSTGKKLGLPPAVLEKQKNFLKVIQEAESEVKLSNGDAELNCKAMFQCSHYCLKTATCPTFLVDFEAVAKPMWMVQDVFQKALLRIASDVTSYVNQKKRSEARNQEKQRKEEADRAAKAKKAEAKAQANKVKQGKVDGHSVFGIDEACFQPFCDRTVLDNVDDHLSTPWVWKSCRSEQKIQAFFKVRGLAKMIFLEHYINKYIFGQVFSMKHLLCNVNVGNVVSIDIKTSTHACEVKSANPGAATTKFQ